MLGSCGKLQRVQLRVAALPGDQVGVAADFDDAAAFQHDNPIGAFDGGEPVRDDQRGAVLHQRLQRGLHVALGFAVQGGRGLVEDQDGGVLEDGARDCNSLALPARQPHAVLADQRVQPVGHGLDEIPGMRGDAGGADLVGRGVALAAVGDVVRQRVVEQHHVLRHQGDVAAQVLQA